MKIFLKTEYIEQKTENKNENYKENKTKKQNIKGKIQRIKYKKLNTRKNRTQSFKFKNNFNFRTLNTTS